MIIKTSPAYTVAIHISGPLDVIEQTCREYCKDVPTCVTVEPTRFIYDGGEETGACVTLRNYPRFPTFPGKLLLKARTLAHRLLENTHQKSVMLTTPGEAIFYSLYTKDQPAAQLHEEQPK